MPRRRSTACLNPLGQLTQSLATRSVVNLMPDANDDGNRPVDDLECGHEGKADVPSEPAV
jgi:hypothetical protein